MRNTPFLVACALSDCNAIPNLRCRGAPNPSPTAQLQTTESTCSKHMHSCRPEKCFPLLLVVGSAPCVSEAGLLGSASMSRSGSWDEDTSGNKKIE